MYVHALFPTPVAYFKFRDFTEDEKQAFNTFAQVKNIGNVSSKDKYVLENKNLASIKTFIEKCLQTYVDKILETEDDIHLYVTQSWVNWTTTSGYHHTHAHPNSIISGVLYLTTESGDKISFVNNTYRQIALTPKNFNNWNSDNWNIPVRSGDLLLFPSSLSHCVPTLERNGVRASLSFNTFLKGDFGVLENANRLTL